MIDIEFLRPRSSPGISPAGLVSLFAGTNGLLQSVGTDGLVRRLGSQVKVGTFTRVMSAASGNVDYTGIGFLPQAVIIFASVQSGSVGNTSVGFSDGTTNWSLLSYSTTGANWANTILTTNVTYNFDDASTSQIQQSSVAGFRYDGFTLSWTKSSSPTATINAGYIAIG